MKNNEYILPSRKISIISTKDSLPEIVLIISFCNWQRIKYDLDINMKYLNDTSGIHRVLTYDEYGNYIGDFWDLVNVVEVSGMKLL